MVDNPIAHAALAVRQNVARWVEKDARAADKVIKREVKSVRKELGASWEGHRMTGGPSLACGGFAACRRYGGYYIPIILAL